MNFSPVLLLRLHQTFNHVIQLLGPLAQDLVEPFEASLAYLGVCLGNYFGNLIPAEPSRIELPKEFVLFLAPQFFS